jgi:ribonuclease P protein component
MWNGETNVPTERAQARQDPRVPEADVDEGRPRRDPLAPPEGTPTAVGLTPEHPGPTAVGSDRIRSRDTFQRLRTAGTRGGSGPIRVRFVEETSWSTANVAYALGKRLGGAVVRNRLRRQLRAIVAELAPSLPPGAYLVSAGPAVTGLRFDELRKAMSRALEGATGIPVSPGIRAGDR